MLLAQLIFFKHCSSNNFSYKIVIIFSDDIPINFTIRTITLMHLIVKLILSVIVNSKERPCNA